MKSRQKPRPQGALKSTRVAFGMPDSRMVEVGCKLSRYPVAVISSGAKAMVDLPRRLERLETLGVPVIGFRTDELPAFLPRSSGLRRQHCVDGAEALARVVHARGGVHPSDGILIANPIPEEAELAPADASAALGRALEDAAQEGVAGKARTPFFLRRRKEHTEGRSVEAHIALAESNAKLGGELAAALSRLQEPLS